MSETIILVPEDERKHFMEFAEDNGIQFCEVLPQTKNHNGRDCTRFLIDVDDPTMTGLLALSWLPRQRAT